MNKNGGITLPPPPVSEEQQYYELCNTVKCTLKPSKVHGIGVFTLRDIKKGERLWCRADVRPQWHTISFANLSKFFDKTHPEIKQLILDRWPAVVNGSQFLSPNYDARLVSFMNHSATPNYDPATDTALKDIKAGKEVFEDYRTMKNYEKVFDWLVDKPSSQV